MCGRFAMTTDPARLAVQLDAVDETGTDGIRRAGAQRPGEGVRPPNYNVAPTTDIAAVVARHDEAHGWAGAERPGDSGDDRVTRRIRLMRWGLLPPWAKAGPNGGQERSDPGKRIGTPPAKGPQLINARAETVTTSPAYRTAAKHKRCLIPMDGYYEWKPNADNPKRGRKTPFYFYRPDGAPLMVAGLWSVWRPDPDESALLTCAVITTDAVGEFAAVHDRMPLSLAERDWDRWLDPDSPAPLDLLQGVPDVSALGMREVSTLVNNVANNGPELIEPVDPGNQPVGLF